MDYIEIIEDSPSTAASVAGTNTAMSAMGEVLLNAAKPPVTIKVVGVGGGGGNAVTHMIRAGIKNVSYITVNTDSQALYKTPADIKIQLGENGQGAGANPNVARAYAEAARPQLLEALQGADMVFITAGLGKGTGTGASAVVAQVAKEIGALTVAVVTKPFTSEGPMRAKIADAAADELGLHSDSLITVLNSKLEALNPDGLMKEWYQAADDVLKSAVSTIVEIIQSNGYQNVDFRDVVSVMGSNRGRALMGTARATGKDRAKTAALAAVCSQLLEEENLRTARGVLINITAAEDSMRGKEITEIIDTIRSHCSDDVTPIYGTTFDDNMGDDLQVTVIVSGIGARNKVSLAGNLPNLAELRDFRDIKDVRDLSRDLSRDLARDLARDNAFTPAPSQAVAHSGTQARDTSRDLGRYTLLSKAAASASAQGGLDQAQSQPHSRSDAALNANAASNPAHSQAQAFEQAAKNFEQQRPAIMQRTGTDDVPFASPAMHTANTHRSNHVNIGSRDAASAMSSASSLPSAKLDTSGAQSASQSQGASQSPSLMSAHSLPLNLGSPNPAIPTLTQAVGSSGGMSAGLAGGAAAQGGSASALDEASLMFNPSALSNPRVSMQNQVKAMQDQGIPALEIPTFLRNQVN